MRDLLVIVPSRGRPASMARLAAAMRDTCTGDTDLLAGVDADDPQLGEYQQLAGEAGFGLEVRGGLRQVVAWINALALPRTGQYRFIGTIGDDNVPRTPGWDTRIMDALADTPFAFGNDLYPRPPGSLCCHVFTRAGVIAALGCFGPPVLRHMYVDPVWMAWGCAAGITYLHDVIIEHLHYTTGKAPADESYAASTALMGEDQAAFTAYCADPAGLAADIATVRAVTGLPPFTPPEFTELKNRLGIPS